MDENKKVRCIHGNMPIVLFVDFSCVSLKSGFTNIFQSYIDCNNNGTILTKMGIHNGYPVKTNDINSSIWCLLSKAQQYT